MDNWYTFLQQQGAQCADQHLLSFGATAQERKQVIEGNVLTALTQLTVLSISGPDALNFMQGQFTSDVRQVSDVQSQLSAWCNPKGRIMVTFRVFQRNDHYALLIPQDNLDALQKRLQMFVLRAKVIIKREPLAVLGFSGPQAAERLKAADVVPMSAVHGCATHSGITTVLTLADKRYALICPTDTAQQLWHTLSADCTPAGTDSWQLLDILDGIPTVSSAIADTFVPQMVNYDLLGGVSFKKGCYAGQEIVARMQYLGTLKQRMYRVRLETEELPVPGDKIYIEGNEQGIGQIMNAQRHDDGSVRALAVIRIQYIEAGDTLHLRSADGPVLILEQLPYALSKEEV